jgi:hypothetical protein
MAKSRQVHVRIWRDAWFLDLESTSKLLFLYLFTNDRVHLSGLYELPLPVIAFETGLAADQVRRALAHFQASGRVWYDEAQGHLFVRSLMHYQASNTLGSRMVAHLRAHWQSRGDLSFWDRWAEAYPETAERVGLQLPPPAAATTGPVTARSVRDEAVSTASPGAVTANPRDRALPKPMETEPVTQAQGTQSASIPRPQPLQSALIPQSPRLDRASNPQPQRPEGAPVPPPRGPGKASITRSPKVDIDIEKEKRKDRKIERDAASGGRVDAERRLASTPRTYPGPISPPPRLPEPPPCPVAARWSPSGCPP